MPWIPPKHQPQYDRLLRFSRAGTGSELSMGKTTAECGGNCCVNLSKHCWQYEEFWCSVCWFFPSPSGPQQTLTLQCFSAKESRGGRKIHCVKFLQLASSGNRSVLVVRWLLCTGPFLPGFILVFTLPHSTPTASNVQFIPAQHVYVRDGIFSLCSAHFDHFRAKPPRQTILPK